MKIFIDTEFTDLHAPYLISLGMVTERSEIDPVLTGMGMDMEQYTEEFYMEVLYPEGKCTPFVREAVLPHLGKYPNVFCPPDEVRERMLNWLQLVRRDDEPIQICFDYDADWTLFCAALGERVTDWISPKMIHRDINSLLHYEFFKKSGLPEHHALFDARANKYAYRNRRYA